MNAGDVKHIIEQIEKRVALTHPDTEQPLKVIVNDGFRLMEIHDISTTKDLISGRICITLNAFNTASTQ